MVKDNLVIAIVDDDESVRRALGRLVRSLSHLPTGFASGETFLASLSDMMPACVFLDMHMPGLTGLQVLEELRTKHITVPTVIITGNDRRDLAEQCIAAGAKAYLQKPLELHVVQNIIEQSTQEQDG